MIRFDLLSTHEGRAQHFFPDTTRSVFSKQAMQAALPRFLGQFNPAPTLPDTHLPAPDPHNRPHPLHPSARPSARLSLRRNRSEHLPPPQNIFTEHPSRTQTLLSSLPDTTGSGVFRWKAPPYQMCLGDITSLAKHCKRSAVRQAACQACASRNLSVRESYPTGSRWSGRPNC